MPCHSGGVPAVAGLAELVGDVAEPAPVLVRAGDVADLEAGHEPQTPAQQLERAVAGAPRERHDLGGLAAARPRSGRGRDHVAVRRQRVAQRGGVADLAGHGDGLLAQRPAPVARRQRRERDREAGRAAGPQLAGGRARARRAPPPAARSGSWSWSGTSNPPVPEPRPSAARASWSASPRSRATTAAWRNESRASGTSPAASDASPRRISSSASRVGGRCPVAMSASAWRYHQPPARRPGRPWQCVAARSAHAEARSSPSPTTSYAAGGGRSR